MDSDSDDDIYGPAEVNGRTEVKMEDVEDGEEEGEEVEDDSDVCSFLNHRESLFDLCRTKSTSSQTPKKSPKRSPSKNLLRTCSRSAIGLCCSRETDKANARLVSSNPRQTYCEDPEVRSPEHVVIVARVKT